MCDPLQSSSLRGDFLYIGKERRGSELVERWTNVLGVKEPLQRVLVCAWLAMTSHCDQTPRDSHVFFFFDKYELYQSRAGIPLSWL